MVQPTPPPVPRFSPLTGILYVRTVAPVNTICYVDGGFSPLTGILYVRTTLDCLLAGAGGTKFQSPDGDSLCPDKEMEEMKTLMIELFQSPDGDSLCPDFPFRLWDRNHGSRFSPLTGILYVRTDD